MRGQQLIDLADNLDRYNRWRKGDDEIDEKDLNSKEIGCWLDKAIEYLYTDGVLQQAEEESYE